MPMAPAASTSPTVTAAAETRTERFGPQIVRPAVSRGGAATKMAVATEPQFKLEPPKPEPIKAVSSMPMSTKPEDTSELLSFAADPKPLTGGLAIGNPRAERSSPGQDHELFASMHAQQSSGSSPVKYVLGGAAVLILAGAVFGFSRMSHQSSSVAAAAPVTETSAPAPTPASVTPQAEPMAAVTPTQATVDTVKPSAKEAKVTDDVRHADAKPAREEHKAAEVKEPELTIKTPDGSVKKRPVETADVQAPTLMAGVSKMPDLHTTVVPPRADFPTTHVTAPKLLNGPRPAFPMAANSLHLTSDTVVLNAKVLPNGKVGDGSVVRGHPVFVQAVKDALKRWQYSPAQLNGQPTEATIEIVFKFGQGS